VPSNPSSRAPSELESAVTEFKKQYLRFLEKNRKYTQIEDNIDLALQKADSEKEIKRSAKIFGEEIARVTRITGDKRVASEMTWRGRVGSFVTKLYPLARLSLRLTSSIAEVLSI
jgi:hypothetical protein